MSGIIIRRASYFCQFVVAHLQADRPRLNHADAVIAGLRGVALELRKQVEAQQANIHRLVKMTFGRGGERVEGPTLFDGLDPEADPTPPVVVEAAVGVPDARPIDVSYRSTVADLTNFLPTTERRPTDRRDTRSHDGESRSLLLPRVRGDFSA